MVSARILIVEDERRTALTIRKALSQMGYTVPAIVSSGEGAIRKVNESRPDLVLMDITLEGKMDGVEAAEHIRSRMDIPLVYLTTVSDEDPTDRAKSTEPFGYLMKPFDNRILRSTIETALYKHQMKRKLKDSEKRFKLLSDAAFEGVVFHENGEILDLNMTFAKMFGCLSPEVIGMNLSNFAAPESYELVVKNIEIKHNGPYEAHCVRKDGSTFIGEFRSEDFPYYERMVRVTAIRDITEHKKAQETVLLLQKAIETVEVGVTITDVNKKIIYTNPAEAAMHEFSVEELIGKDVRVFSPPQRRKETSIKQLRDMKNWKREALNIRRDGTVFHVYLTSTSVRAESGQPLGIVTISEDITSLKQASEALREREEQFQAMFETAAEAIISFNSEGSIIFWNRMAESIFGYTSNEAIGKSTAFIIAEKSRKIWQENLRQAEAKAKATKITLSGLKKDATEFLFTISLAPWKIKDDLCFTAIIRTQPED